MKKLLLIGLALCLVTFGASAQSAAEIAAAKSLARSYGYSNDEINAVLNHDISGRVSGPAQQRGTLMTQPLTVPNQALPGQFYAGTEYPIEVKPIDTTATSSPVFGHDFFISKGLSLIPSITAPVPASYVLGPGDNISVSVWGSANADDDYQIGSDGTIRVDGVGPIPLAGKTVEEAENTLKSRLSSIYGGLRNGSSSLQITVGKIRGISVYVLGGVIVPGVYTLPSLASIATAIFMAGGIKESGSVRNIHIYRGGEEVGVFDLYAFIFEGKYHADMMLQDGDIVSVGQVENIVSLDGSVQRAMKFEMRSDETLEQLLRYSGGFTPIARRDLIHVDRQVAAVGTSYDVPAEEFGTFTLAAGDSVWVSSMVAKIDNRVVIDGSVHHPGPYAISERLKTLKDLIDAAGGLQEGTYMSRGYISRFDADMKPTSVSFDLADVMAGRLNIDLMRDDSVRVFSTMELQDSTKVTIQGNVNDPGEFDYRAGLTLGDLILMAGGMKHGTDVSKVEIAVRGREEPGFICQLDVATDPQLMGTELQPFDKVFIRPQENFRPIKSIEVRGEVKYPGFYAVESNSVRLSSILDRCGGFTDDAFVKGAKLRRKMTEYEFERSQLAQEVAERQNLSAGDTLKPLPEHFTFKNGKLIKTKTVTKTEEGKEPEEETVEEEVDVPTYYVSIDIAKAMKNPNTDADLILCDGDVLEVPQMNNTVKISGGVYMPNTVTYNPSYSWRDYVNMAGGFVKGARKGKTYAVYQDGSSAVRGSSHFRMEPGMEIVVPVDTTQHNRMSIGEAVSIASASTSLVYVVALLVNLFKSN
jgi:protein involved in polysaccharide export with SLBB domain